MTPSAVLDACVLYPAPLRDLLLRLASEHLFDPRWSDDILREFVDNLLKDRPDLDAGRLRRTQDLMNAAFPSGRVTGYRGRIAGLSLPDPNDRHVLAAAIAARASTIVTFNLKDFPVQTLRPFGVAAMHPDRFVLDLLDRDAPAVLRGAETQAAGLRNPPTSLHELLSVLAQQGLTESVKRIGSLLPP
ncbi:MAG: PIN domain-containing protein [Myxococcota bacterium]